MWLILSMGLYIGARAGVGIWLGCFAAAALITSGAAFLQLNPLGQLQLFLGGALAAILIVEKLSQLWDKF